METRVSFEKLTRESPFDVWQERITSLLHTKNLGKWTQDVPVTADDRAQSIKARAFVVLALSEEMVQLVSAVPFCNDVMRVLKTECDGTVHWQAVQIEEEVQKLVQRDTESLKVYCERGRELMRKIDVLRFADKDRRMVCALVRRLCHEIRGSVARKLAERPDQTFQEVVTFL